MPIGGIIAGAGSLLGGIFQGNAATDAAGIAAKSANNALGLDAGVLKVIQQQLSPYYNVGSNALGAINNLLLGPGAQGFTNFTPSSVVGAEAPQLNLPNFYSDFLGPAGGTPSSPFLPTSQFQSSPGYNYELQQQQQAIENSGAGKSGALSGNTLMALQKNAQGLASQDYWTANNNWYNNLTQGFNAATQQALGGYNAQNSNYWNQYNAIQGNRGNFLAALQNLASGGQSAAANQGSAGVNLAGQAGQNLITAGNAQASGILGNANALSSGFNGLSNNLLAPQGTTANSQLAFLLGGGGGGGGSNLSALLGGFGQGGDWSTSNFG